MFCICTGVSHHRMAQMQAPTWTASHFPAQLVGYENSKHPAGRAGVSHRDCTASIGLYPPGDYQGPSPISLAFHPPGSFSRESPFMVPAHVKVCTEPCKHIHIWDTAWISVIQSTKDTASYARTLLPAKSQRPPVFGFVFVFFKTEGTF